MFDSNAEDGSPQAVKRNQGWKEFIAKPIALTRA